MTRVSFNEALEMVEFFSRDGRFYDLILACDYHAPNSLFGDKASQRFTTIAWICDDCWVDSLRVLRRHKKRHG